MARRLPIRQWVHYAHSWVATTVLAHSCLLVSLLVTQVTVKVTRLRVKVIHVNINITQQRAAVVLRRRAAMNNGQCLRGALVERRMTLQQVLPTADAAAAAAARLSRRPQLPNARTRLDVQRVLPDRLVTLVTR